MCGHFAISPTIFGPGALAYFPLPKWPNLSPLGIQNNQIVLSRMSNYLQSWFFGFSAFTSQSAKAYHAIMPSFSTLKRSSPDLQRLLIRRVRIPQFSAPPSSSSSSTSSSSLPVINSCNYDSNPHDDSVSESCLKWISALVVGSSLGLVSWFSTSNSDLDSALSNKALSYADWSNATT